MGKIMVYIILLGIVCLFGLYGYSFLMVADPEPKTEVLTIEMD